MYILHIKPGIAHVSRYYTRKRKYYTTRQRSVSLSVSVWMGRQTEFHSLMAGTPLLVRRSRNFSPRQKFSAVSRRVCDSNPNNFEKKKKPQLRHKQLDVPSFCCGPAGCQRRTGQKLRKLLPPLTQPPLQLHSCPTLQSTPKTLQLDATLRLLRAALCIFYHRLLRQSVLVWTNQ